MSGVMRVDFGMVVLAWFLLLFTARDSEEGALAFLEKREPIFR